MKDTTKAQEMSTLLRAKETDEKHLHPTFLSDMIGSGKFALKGGILMNMHTLELLDLEHTLAKDYLAGFEYPWQALGGIKEMILKLGESLSEEEYNQVSPRVWVHKTAVVAPTAYLGAPCIIGAETQVRHCAFVRGSALVGRGCVVGNSVELKNVILFDEVQVPHYNYVGDSILGYRSHMGAGSITSNVKSDKSKVTITCQNEKIETDLKKCGAMLGDNAEIGCNAVVGATGKKGDICVVARNEKIADNTVIPAGTMYDSLNGGAK